MSLFFGLEAFLGRFFVVVLEVLGLFVLGGTVAVVFVVFVPVVDSSSSLLEVISTLVTKVILVESCGGTSIRLFALEGL